MNFTKRKISQSGTVEWNHNSRKHFIKWRIVHIDDSGKKRVYDTGILPDNEWKPVVK